MSNQPSLPGGSFAVKSQRICRRGLLYLVIVALALSFIGMPVQAAETRVGEETAVTTVSVAGGNTVADANETVTDDTVHIDTVAAAYSYGPQGNADIFGVPTAKYKPDTIDASEDDRSRNVGDYGPVKEDDSESDEDQ